MFLRTAISLPKSRSSPRKESVYCMAVSKFRIRFQKARDLRFLSHHDLMRTFERMLRRAALPFRSTEGFHPKPRMAFASALALGIVGLQEVVEIEFDGELAAEEVHDRLARQALPGLVILSVRPMDPKLKAQPCRATYRLPLDRDRRIEIVERLRQLVQEPQCWVQRLHPQPRRVDIRPYFVEFEVSRTALDIVFRVTPQGTARPEECIELLGLSGLLQDGAVLERTALEIQDETPSVHTEPRVVVITTRETLDEERVAIRETDPNEVAPAPGA
jgi:radical SAM-linked protein